MYIVTRGSAWIRSGRDARAFELRAGDVALLPHGAAHVLSSDPAARTAPSAEFFAEHGGGRGVDMIAGGGGAETHLDTLCFEARSVNARRLLGAVPALLVLPHHACAAWTSHVARALSALIACPDIAESDTSAKLSEVLFGIALRDLLPRSKSANETPDSTVTIARVLIHADLAHAWTVATLARRVGMSKSSFHDRFHRATGASPMDYVASARMQHARELLSRPELSVQDVAEAVGYQSASSFSVAFRRWSGRTPTDVRRAALARRA